jgi:hypothetical protein
MWWVNGTAVGAFIYYFARSSFREVPMTPSAMGPDLWCLGVIIYIAVLVVA